MTRLPQLLVGTVWITVTVTGPVDVIANLKGYAPVLPVRKEATQQEYILYISANNLECRL